MELLNYLREHGLGCLCQEYSIKTDRHGEYPSLVLLKYDQINSPMGVKLVQQCRGVILDEADNWRVVSYPYDKFFNHGEGHASEIHWPSATIYDKLDGSLMTLYHYDGEWVVASSGTPDGSGTVGMGGSMTMAGLFWETWSALDYELPADEGCCYMFELMTPRNRIVVPHKESRLVLHGVRNVKNFDECDPAGYARDNGWEVVRSYTLGTIDEVVEAAKGLNPMAAEGYVVRDGRFRRLKVKSPQYVALHHMKDGFSSRRMVELVRANEGDEFLGYFPEFADEYNDIRTRYHNLLETVGASYSEIAGIEGQKDFAMKATQHPYSGALFALRSGKAASVESFYAEMPADRVLRAIDTPPPPPA